MKETITTPKAALEHTEIDLDALGCLQAINFPRLIAPHIADFNGVIKLISHREIQCGEGSHPPEHCTPTSQRNYRIRCCKSEEDHRVRFTTAGSLHWEWLSLIECSQLRRVARQARKKLRFRRTLRVGPPTWTLEIAYFHHDVVIGRARESEAKAPYERRPDRFILDLALIVPHGADFHDPTTVQMNKAQVTYFDLMLERRRSIICALEGGHLIWRGNPMNFINEKEMLKMAIDDAWEG